MVVDPGSFLARAPIAQLQSPAAHPEWMRRRLLVVPTLVVLNLVVFLLWGMAVNNRPLLVLLRDNFVVSTSHLVSGRPWTLLTAAFSHQELWHLAVNMLVLYSFGGVLERLLGRRVFTTFYLVTAIVSSASHCAVSTLLLGRSDLGALGASGAVSGLLLAYSLLFPKHRILLFWVIPVPALVGALLFVGLDIWGLVAQSAGGGLPIGHGAHLGGAACGGLFYLTYLRQRIRRFASARPPGGAVLEVTEEEATELDRLRAKVEREGPQALTVDEQAFLRAIRQRFADQGR